MSPDTIAPDLAIAPGTEPEARPAPALPLGTFVALIAWPLVVLGVGGVLGYQHVRAELRAEFDAEFALRPPVAVLAPSAYIPTGSRDRGAVDDGLQRAFAVARKLSESGYVVIDRQAVLDAPAAVVVEGRR